MFTDSTSELVTAFESEFANLTNAQHAIAFGYARHGLTSILTAVGCRAGDEVVLSPLTCKVVPLALLSLNLRPRYADISKDTLNLDPDQVESSIGPATGAVLFQHTYGNSAGIEKVAEIAAEKAVPMVEDCAQCLPYSESSQLPGSWGTAAIFSNNLGKPLPAGSGGVAIVKDITLQQSVRAIRDSLPYRSAFADIMLRFEAWVHRLILRPHLYWPAFELNRRLRATYHVRPLDVEIASEINEQAFQVSAYQMRQGLRWLRKLQAITNHRISCCADYVTRLRDVDGVQLPCSGPPEPFYYFPILVNNKAELLSKAKKRRTELIPWPIQTPIYPIEEESHLSAYDYQAGSCPVAENVARRLIGLPTDPSVRIEHRNAIITLLQDHSLTLFPARQLIREEAATVAIGPSKTG